MIIRRATDADVNGIWAIIEPTIRAGESYTLARDMERDQALAYWLAAGNDVFVAEEDGTILGTYYMRPNQGGGGRHVCNCGYMTALAATGRGIASRMCEHSLDYARAAGYRAMQFNFVVSTNHRAVALWERMGFDVVGRLPQAFDHPIHGLVDALVMHRAL
jgi:L-amino acid N-acyltransferase YncA